MTLGPLMIDIAGPRLLPEDRELLEHPLVGSVILFTRNFRDAAQIAALVQDIRAVRTPPLLVAVDHEGGRVQRFRQEFSAVPPMRRVGLEWVMDRSRGRDLARHVGWLIGAELRGVGIDLAFSPVVDLDYGVSEIIGDRAFHRDPEVVAELGIALMLGLRDAGMAATAKHFPGHGAVVADSHVALPVDRREFADLEEDLRPYRRLIANGLPSIMIAHVVFPAVDSRPASLSPRWIGEILRGEFDFRGAVFADDLSMGGAAACGSIVERAELALAAGCDMLPVCNDRAAVVRLLSELRVSVDPVSSLRLARLHGKPVPARAELLASARWQSCAAAINRCLAPPALALDGEQA